MDILNQRMIFADNWVIDGNNAWMVSVEKDELFWADTEKKIVKLIGVVQERQSDHWRRIGACVKHGDDIYFCPNRGFYIWKYNIKSAEWKKITFGDKVKPNVSLYIHYVWLLQDEILMYSYRFKSLFRLSLATDEVTECTHLSADETECWGRPLLVGDKIYVMADSTPAMYKYDVNSRTVEKMPINLDFKGWSTLAYADGKFYLSGRDRHLYSWQEETGKIEQYDLPPSFGLYHFNSQDMDSWLLDTSVDSYEYYTFQEILPFGEEIWLIPGQTNEILYMNIHTREMKVFHIAEEEEDLRSLKCRYLHTKYRNVYSREGRYLGLYSYKNECLIEVDTKEKKYKTVSFDISNIPLQSFGNKERCSHTLPFFLGRLPKNEPVEINRNTIHGNVGKIIYDIL